MATFGENGQQGGEGPPPGGDIKGPNSAGCTTYVALCTHIIADLAGRQIDQDHVWTSEMRRQSRGLSAHAPIIMEQDTIHRIEHAPSAHRLFLICKLEASRARERAEVLRAEECRAKARADRDSFQGSKLGLPNASGKLIGGRGNHSAS